MYGPGDRPLPGNILCSLPGTGTAVRQPTRTGSLSRTQRCTGLARQSGLNYAGSRQPGQRRTEDREKSDSNLVVRMEGLADRAELPLRFEVVPFASGKGASRTTTEHGCPTGATRCCSRHATG